FRYKGTLCRLFDLVGPDGGIAVCTVDGGKPVERKRFDWYCTYHRLQAVTVAATPKGGEHTVTIEISPKQPDREPVLKRVRGEKNFDPKRYDGTNLWIGYIMVRGELVTK
ncbi:SGNH/GDSL hydrolase family protein, partial [Planctomycetota bacterium]